MFEATARPGREEATVNGPDSDRLQGQVQDQRTQETFPGQRRSERWDDTGLRAASGTGVIGAPATGRTDPDIAEEARKERFGGLNPGAAFFGWLVAVAVTVLLAGIVGAVAVAVGTNADVTQADLTADASSLGIVAAVVLLVVLVVGYYAGGYVAGRMSRFSGGRQGLGVWLLGLLVTIAMVALGAVLGQQYDVISRVDLPRVSMSTSTLSTGGVIAGAAVLLGTLLAALAGGAVGTRYHRKVDRHGWEA
jgi:hypothetical protein